MRLALKYLAIMVLFMFGLGLMTARAEPQTWTAVTGDWFTAANWTNWASPPDSRVPEAGDDVYITNVAANVLLTNSTPWLSSLVMSNATLSFSNWDTMLYVTNLTICQGATQTCAGPFTNTAMSNRVNLTCSNLVIESGGGINVNAMGYSGGYSAAGAAKGHGPGVYIAYSGGGYGGAGGGYEPFYWGSYFGLHPSTVYGLFAAPQDPGSGGWSWTLTYTGGNGGGAVRITAAQVVVNGSINANAGWNSSGNIAGCGGSGGGIYITCSTITGTNGTITAIGGTYKIDYYGGGGGRIAVIYDPAAQINLPVPSISFSVLPGLNRQALYAEGGDIGTLYFPDNYFFSATNLFNGQWMVPGFTNLALADWTVSNVWIRLAGQGFTLTVTNTLSVISDGTNYYRYKLELTNVAAVSCGQCLVRGAVLGLGRPIAIERDLPLTYGTSSVYAGPTMNCSGDLTLTNFGRLYVSSGSTNTGLAAGYGAQVNVSGDIRVYTNSWIYPSTHPTNGAAVLFNMRNLTLDSGGGINADWLGYIGSRRGGADIYPDGAFGPGSKAQVNGWGSTCGSGYGGAGGRGHSASPGGQPYGSSNAPVAPGSGGYRWSGGSPFCADGTEGGGSVQIRATDTVAIQGTITANGMNGSAFYNSSAASGGGIYITCCRFIGDSNGVLRANGGNGLTDVTYGSGGGGGGRIAIWRMFDKSTSIISNYVNGGAAGGGQATDEAGTNGTVVLGWLTPYGTIFKMH